MKKEQDLHNEFSLEKEDEFLKHCQNLKSLAQKLRVEGLTEEQVKDELYNLLWYK